jgi:hypothetical protein
MIAKHFQPALASKFLLGFLLGSQTYIYRWDRQGRKGQRCLVLARGKMNSCLVRFGDGYTIVTSRNALKLATGEAALPKIEVAE